ncbi:MAG: hypothetical protein AVDCRST_MAG68-2291, partial [uncultured Gemmatimonadetes bacterium]
AIPLSDPPLGARALAPVQGALPRRAYAGRRPHRAPPPRRRAAPCDPRARV